VCGKRAKKIKYFYAGNELLGKSPIPFYVIQKQNFQSSRAISISQAHSRISFVDIKREMAYVLYEESRIGKTYVNI